MTSVTTVSGQVIAPTASVAPHRFQPHGDHTCSKERSSSKSAFSQKQDFELDVKSISLSETCPSILTGKPPGAQNKKKSIQRSSSSDDILTRCLTGEWSNPNFHSVIKPLPSPRTDRSPLSATKSASPMTKSHLNLWPVGSLFKKRFRSSFKKVCQGSTEGLNQELEKLTLTSEDVQRLQHVPDGHRAPVQELLDMFSDSPPSGGTPSHLSLISTLSSSSSSPPPAISSLVSSEPSRHHAYHQHHLNHHHHHHHQSQSAWSPRGSPEVPASFTLGSEVKQVKPLRSSTSECQEMSRDERPPATSKLQDVPSAKSSSLLSCSMPSGPLPSPITIRANIPSNESAFATYPTLPKSFKIKDTLCHGNRAADGFGATTARIGNS